MVYEKLCLGSTLHFISLISLTVKKSYLLPLVWKNHMVKHMASKTKWPVSLSYVFFFLITSQMYCGKMVGL